MTEIWKFKIPENADDNDGEFTVDMPSGARILDAQLQYDIGAIWAMVNPTNNTEKRRFALIGTGWDLEQYDFTVERLRYISTIQFRGGSIVFHLFEVK